MRKKLKKIKLLVLDSDGVTVKRGTEIKEKQSQDFLEVCVKAQKISDELAEKINKLKQKLIICVSSGRGMIWLQSMYDKILGENFMLMAENGNLLFKDGDVKQLFDYSDDYFILREKIENELKKLPIKGFEPKQIILTVHCTHEMPEVRQIVKKLDKKNILKAMWVSEEAFDIMRKDISKASGLKKLINILNLKANQVMAVGDSINDKEMLELAGIGIWVEPEGNKLGGEILVDYLLGNKKKA